MSLCLTLSDLTKLRPCPGSSRRVHALLRKLNADKAHCFTAAEAREAGCTFDDIAWAASVVSRTDREVERRLRHWMADCATRVLHLYERDHPTDMRVRDAIKAARDYADGRIDDAKRDAAWAVAWAAVKETTRDATRAAAREAAWAATRAATRTSSARAVAVDAAWAVAWAVAREAEREAVWAVARTDTARAVAREAEREAAWAVARAVAGDAKRAVARAAAAWAATREAEREAAWAVARAEREREAAWEAEEAFQFDRLILWLSLKPPKPLRLPAKQNKFTPADRLAKRKAN